MISIVMPFLHKDELMEMTVNTIKNIRETTSEEHEIILVHTHIMPLDDLDGLVDKYIWLSKPLTSLAATYNRGFQQAEGDVIVNMHNDVELPQKWDKELSAAARKGLIGCVFVDESESDCELRRVSKSNGKYIPSCCFSISRDTWDILGGYDEDFKGFHYEDNDLFLRGAQSGHGPCRCEVTVKHKRGMTRSTVDFDRDEYNLLQNHKKYEEKHADFFKQFNVPVFILTLPATANFKEGMQ